MALHTKIIKSKIKSVQNIRKITRAMEMVAATKMRKAVLRAQESKQYVLHAYELLKNLAQRRDFAHPLLDVDKNAEDTLIIAIASNRGLCGSYNSGIKKALRTMTNGLDGTHVKYIAVGKHIERMMKRLPGELLASFTEFGDSIEEEHLWPVNSLIVNEFKKKTYKKVVLLYTRFDSALSYKPSTRHMLPIRSEDLEQVMDEMKMGRTEEHTDNLSTYVFEPSEEDVLDFVLPRVTEVYLYQAMLESLASEHSSRMMAMRSASDNAKSMIESLTVGFNRARQAAITQEIAEITTGAMREA